MQSRELASLFTSFFFHTVCVSACLVYLHSSHTACVSACLSTFVPHRLCVGLSIFVSHSLCVSQFIYICLTQSGCQSGCLYKSHTDYVSACLSTSVPQSVSQPACIICFCPTVCMPACLVYPHLSQTICVSLLGSSIFVHHSLCVSLLIYLFLSQSLCVSACLIYLFLSHTVCVSACLIYLFVSRSLCVSLPDLCLCPGVCVSAILY